MVYMASILRNLNLRGTPTKHMASLVSCVTHSLNIDKVQNCDLVSILTSLKCQELSIYRQSLGREETRALVQAMESGVEVITLGRGVTLDMETLAEFSGQKMCKEVALHNDTAARYKKELVLKCCLTTV